MRVIIHPENIPNPYVGIILVNLCPCIAKCRITHCKCKPGTAETACIGSTLPAIIIVIRPWHSLWKNRLLRYNRIIYLAVRICRAQTSPMNIKGLAVQINLKISVACYPCDLYGQIRCHTGKHHRVIIRIRQYYSIFICVQNCLCSRHCVFGCFCCQRRRPEKQRHTKHQSKHSAPYLFHLFLNPPFSFFATFTLYISSSAIFM